MYRKEQIDKIGNTIIFLASEIENISKNKTTEVVIYS